MCFPRAQNCSITIKRQRDVWWHSDSGIPVESWEGLRLQAHAQAPEISSEIREEMGTTWWFIGLWEYSSKNERKVRVNYDVSHSVAQHDQGQPKQTSSIKMQGEDLLATTRWSLTHGNGTQVVSKLLDIYCIREVSNISEKLSKIGKQPIFGKIILRLSAIWKQFSRSQPYSHSVYFFRWKAFYRL